MANAKTRPLTPKQLQDDLDAFAALKNIVGYKPSNPDYEISNGNTAKEARTAAASRDDEVAAQWAFHDYVLGTKDQVKAQFGPNSNEIQALGLKKKSEYKSPSRRNTTP